MERARGGWGRFRAFDFFPAPDPFFQRPENSLESETFSPFAINSTLRIEIFLFPLSTSAKKLRSIPTRSANST